MELKIGNTIIGNNHPTYFVADIAANHDGSLERAIELIRLAAEAGANAAKFQNFRGPEIVSDYGFSHMDGQVSHQAKWKRVSLKFITQLPFLLSGRPFSEKLATNTVLSFSPRPMILTPLICWKNTYPPTKSARATLPGLKPACASLKKRQTRPFSDGCLKHRRRATRGGCHFGSQSAVGSDAMQHQLHRRRRQF